jgi:hypothetical protein
LLEKRRYYLIILTILLFVSIDISSYNYIALGKEEDDEDEDANNAIEKENDDGQNGEDFSLNELFRNNDEDNDIKEIEKDKVPFILPFTAVPFP